MNYNVRFTVALGLDRGTRSGKSDVQEIDGTIYYIDEGEKEHEAGRLRIYKIPEGMDLITASDISNDCEEAITDIFDFDGDLKPAVARKLGDYGSRGSAVLFIHEVRVNKPHRGQRLGLMAIAEAIEVFGGDCGIAALVASPFFHRNDDDTELEQDPTKAAAKLGQHYQRLGFVKVVRGSYALNLTYEWGLKDEPRRRK